jgi:hypothetical protein
MIVALTLIGLASSNTSIFEIKLSGNKRASTDAFYSADAGISQIITNIGNFNLSHYDEGTRTYSPFIDSTNITPNPTHVVATITYLPAQSGAPRGMGFSAINLGYAHYQIESVGKDQANLVSSGSTLTLQEEVVRVLPAQQ